jgi:hypothetical protein
MNAGTSRMAAAILVITLLSTSTHAQVRPGDIVLTVFPERIDHFRRDGTRVVTMASTGSGNLGTAVTSFGFAATRFMPSGRGDVQHRPGRAG